MVLKNLKNLVKHNTILFILFVVTQLISVGAILLSYGVYADNHYMLIDSSERYISMDVSPIFDDNGESPVDMSKVKAAFPEIIKSQDGNFQYLSMYCDGHFDNPISSNQYAEASGGNISKEDSKIYDVNITVTFGIENGRYVFGELGKSFLNSFSNEWYTEEDLNEGNLVCIPSYGYYEINDEEWSIDGVKYKVLGSGKTPLEGCGPFKNGFAMPLESTADNMKLEGFLMIFEKPILHSEYNELKEAFEEAFDYQVVVSDFCSVSLDETQTFKTMMWVAVMVSVAAAFITCLVYRYILEKRIYLTGIYQICGCTRIKSALIYITEVLILLGVSTVAGTLIFLKFIMPAVSPYFSYFSDIYSKQITYVLPALYFGIVLAASVTMIAFKMRKTPKEIITEQG